MIGLFRGGLALGALLTLVLAEAAGDSKVQHGFLHKVYTGPSGDTAKYQVFVPDGYEGDKAYPVILFLHGAGETGTDGERQAQVGLGPAIKKKAKTFPCIVVFPQ